VVRRAAGLGAIAGQVFGGLLIRADVAGLGWRAVFLVNLSVGLSAVPLAHRVLPSECSERRPSLDPLGALGLAASAAFLAYFASLMFTLTLLLQAGFGLDPVQAGLAFVPVGVTFTIVLMGVLALRQMYDTNMEGNR
jgi:MFS family permease